MQRAAASSVSESDGDKQALSWHDSETSQMKHIHAAYLKSLDVKDLAQLSQQGSKDPEFFLPRHSPLRSERGEMQRPAGRGPFENYEAFKRSIEVGYWLEQFLDSSGRLEAFNELGKRIVSEVCVEQSTKDLRVSSGPKLLYDKREHVTPLALCLHEIKTWAAEVLPVMSPGDPATHLSITQRVKYLVCLCPRDVWCTPGRLSSKGLSSSVHSKLVTLLQRIIMFLTQANKIEFKRYCQRQVHRKLGLLLHGLRGIISMSSALISCIASVDEAVSPGSKLELSDLVDGSIKQTRASFSNMANVCLYYTCKAPLMRGGLSSDYSMISDDEAGPLVKGWAAGNPWAKRGALSPAPDMLISMTYPPMPQAYGAAYDVLYADLRGAARHVVWPQSLKAVTGRWKVVFTDAKDLAEASRAVQVALAALHDLAPALFMIYRLWEISADDEVLLLDSLRPQTLRCGGDVLLRLCTLRAAEQALVKSFTDLASKQLAAQGRLEDAAQLLYNGPGVRREPHNPIKPPAKTKVTGDPIFLRNLDVAAAELLPQHPSAYAAIFHLAQELCRDAYDYAFGAPALAQRGANQPPPPAKARVLVSICEALLAVRAEDYHGGFNLSRVSLNIGADWLLLRNFYSDALADVAANAFEDVSEAAAFKAQEDDAQRDLENILAANAGHVEHDVPDVSIDESMPDDDDDHSASGAGGSGARKKSLFGRLTGSRTSSSAPSSRNLAAASSTTGSARTLATSASTGPSATSAPPKGKR